MRGLSLIAAAALLVGLGLPVPAAAAGAAACRNGFAKGDTAIPARPWAQRWLAPERAWPLSDGGHAVTVAVVDTGVDRVHPQLADAVLPGVDLLGDAGAGRVDCTGHGTAVASLIAARPADGIGFAGVAPKARILPVRVVERADGDIDPAKVAAGIRWATAHGATIVNIALVVPDSAAVRDAVADAVRHDVLVVAGAGTLGTGTRASGPSYPAGYDGVLGVVGADASGNPPEAAWTGSHVDLTAPGLDLIAAAPALGHTTAWARDAGLATAMVSGSAALLRSARPGLTAAAVAERLTATADPAPAGRRSDRFGWGYVNPYRALSEPDPSATAGARGAEVVERAAVAPADGRVAAAAQVLTAVFLAVALLLLGLRGVRSRRRAARGGR
ncbi:type VII secretion-associated serine protease mycosin [Allocatelliglobosispora scoriae]|uniref:Type VII secretion-associated serine protease mycosin n=1 Tax=Allocatelliglobosispora scoriae TaxID=643052 RepID=A0A841BLC8_9ACTN|nr:S8 family serine peptidase [Allocatelliglobosispora scoriae]MBB5867552.1 type VII secretion-associated serine protease mycosin [Allocatelliglobosispora scoriae]